MGQSPLSRAGEKHPLAPDQLRVGQFVRGAEAACQHGLTVAEVEHSREKFLLGTDNALRTRPKAEAALNDEQIKKLKQKSRGFGAGYRHPSGGVEALPFGSKDSRRVRAARSGVSERRRCHVLGVTRAGLHRTAATDRWRRCVDPPWTEWLHQLIQRSPTFGYWRLLGLVRVQERLVLNRKAVSRAPKQKGWFVHQRVSTPRPRVRDWTSRASRINKRWAMDVPVSPGRHDGWGHLAAVIDCHDREVIGYEVALRNRAKEAERAVEAACLQLFGTLCDRREPQSWAVTTT